MRLGLGRCGRACHNRGTRAAHGRLPRLFHHVGIRARRVEVLGALGLCGGLPPLECSVLVIHGGRGACPPGRLPERGALRAGRLVQRQVLHRLVHLCATGAARAFPLVGEHAAQLFAEASAARGARGALLAAATARLLAFVHRCGEEDYPRGDR